MQLERKSPDDGKWVLELLKPAEQRTSLTLILRIELLRIAETNSVPYCVDFQQVGGDYDLFDRVAQHCLRALEPEVLDQDE